MSFCYSDDYSEFSGNNVLYKSFMHRLVGKFEETGSACAPKHNRRRTTVLDKQPLQDIKENLLRFPQTSFKKILDRKQRHFIELLKTSCYLSKKAFRGHVSHKLVSADCDVRPHHYCLLFYWFVRETI